MFKRETTVHHSSVQRLPEWMRKKVLFSADVLRMKQMLRKHKLHTVCQSAGCPNLSTCFEKHTATFLILGNICTRHCRFCGVTQGNPMVVDRTEPLHVAEAVSLLELKHVVITSVTRDDLQDGGASHFTDTVRAVKERNPESTIELLIPDFQGSETALRTVLDCGIDVINHNVETVPRLYPEIRPEAVFQRSLRILEFAGTYRTSIMVKTGLMLGLGETPSEVEQVLHLLSDISCDALTIGQYLRPEIGKIPVREYIHPELFRRYENYARSLGIPYVKAGPFVRSSFQADEMIKKFQGASL